MSITKLCFHLAVFLCTLTAGFFAARLFLIPLPVEVRVAAPAPPPTVTVGPMPAKINFKVQQVVLDRGRAKTYVQLVVERAPNTISPTPLLLAMWLDTPPNAPADKSQQLGCGVEGVPLPSSLGESVTLTVVFHCGASPSELTNTYYAHVVPMQLTNDPLRRFTYNESDVSPPIPVVIEHGPRHRQQ